MPTLAAEVAQAVTDLLRSTALPMAVSVDRRWAPHYDAAELKDPRICVVPVSVDLARISRAQDTTDITIQVGILALIPDGEELPDLDPYVETAQVAAAAVAVGRLPTMSHMQLVETKHSPLVDADALAQNGMFVSVITSVWRASHTARD